MVETILVGAVLALVVFMAVRAFVRALTGKNPGSGCGEGCQCGTAGDPVKADPGPCSARGGERAER